MNKQSTTPSDRLVGYAYIMAQRNKSRSTILREINKGIFPKPDVIGGNGRSNQWLKSTVDTDFEKIKQ